MVHRLITLTIPASSNVQRNLAGRSKRGNLHSVGRAYTKARQFSSRGWIPEGLAPVVKTKQQKKDTDWVALEARVVCFRVDIATLKK